MSDKTYLCSINPRLINKNERNDQQAFAQGFIQSAITPDELATLVGRGVAFSFVFKNDHREAKNFMGTEVVAVDIDGTLTVDEVCTNPFVLEHAGFAYTTPSHTSDEPRLRVVFFLSEGIDDPKRLKQLATALTIKLTGDLAATDAARLFYGSSNCQIFTFDKELSQEAIADLLVQGEEALRLRSASNQSGQSTWSSSRRVSSDLAVRLKNGNTIAVDQITKNTTIFCPDHFDTHPSAFVGLTPNGSKFIYCHACQTTRWVGQNKQSLSFYDFEESVLKTFKKGDYQEATINTAFGPMTENLLVGGQIHFSQQRHFSIKTLQKGLTFVKSPKGSGKTTMMLDVLQPLTEVIRGGDLSLLFLEENEDPNEQPLYERSQTNFSILLIGHRQALIRELCKRLNLNCYLDDERTSTGSSFNLTGQSRRKHLERQKRYGVCLDSINIVQSDAYDLVILDESEQVLGHFLSETMAARRSSVFRRFQSIVRSSKRVICLDADLSWISFMTLTDLAGARSKDLSFQDKSSSTNPFHSSKPVHVFINHWVPTNRTIEVYKSKDHLISDLESDLGSGKKIFFTSNSKKQVDRLASALLSKYPEKQILKVTSENSNSDHIQSILLSAKQKLPTYDLVLTSPSLSTGIDLTFDNEEIVFEVVYGVFQPMVNTHFEIDQQLSRVRQTNITRCWISPEKFFFEEDLSVVSIDLFRENLTANTYSGLQPIDYEEIDLQNDPFIRMGSLILSQQRASMNNLRENFIAYKERQGVTVVGVDKDEAKRKSGKSIDDLGGIIATQERTNAILESKAIDQRTFIGILDDKNASKSIAQNLLLSCERHHVEFFNRRALCREDVHAFLDGRHEKIRLLERLLFLHREVDESPNDTPSVLAMRREQVLRLLESKDLQAKIDQPLDLKAFVWGELLASTPLYQGNRFTSAEISAEDLNEFLVKVDEYRWVFDTLLVPLRRDVKQKPMRFLGDRLNEVGLDLVTARVDQKGGKKTYFYRLDPVLLDVTIQLVEKRRENPSTTYIPFYWKSVHEENGFDSPVYERIFDGDGRNPKLVWSIWQEDIEEEFKKRRVKH